MIKSADDARNEITKAIDEKKYSDACCILFDISYAHESDARFDLVAFLESLPLESYSSDDLKQLCCASFKSSNLTRSRRLVEALALYDPLAAAYLVSLHKDVSSDDSEHYFSAFQSILRELDMGFANLPGEAAHYKKMVHLAGILLSTRNADSSWYCCEIRDSSDFPCKSVILNFFALYGKTKFFEQAIGKGVSIGQQRYSASTEFVSVTNPLIHWRIAKKLNKLVGFGASFCEKTPLDYALQSNSQGVIKLIEAEIEKLTASTISELIFQNKWQRLTTENKEEIEAQLKENVYKKFLPYTEKAICHVEQIISGKMQETINAFYPLQSPLQPAPTLEQRPLDRLIFNVYSFFNPARKVAGAEKEAIN